MVLKYIAGLFGTFHQSGIEIQRAEIEQAPYFIVEGTSSEI